MYWDNKVELHGFVPVKLKVYEEKVSVIKQKSVEKLFEVVSLMEREFEKSEPKNWLDIKSLNEKPASFRQFFLLCSGGRDRTYDQSLNRRPLYR